MLGGRRAPGIDESKLSHPNGERLFQVFLNEEVLGEFFICDTRRGDLVPGACQERVNRARVVRSAICSVGDGRLEKLSQDVVRRLNEYSHWQHSGCKT